jgi:hypothetical protein
MGQHEHPMETPDALLSVFQSRTKVLKDNNQHLQSSDVTEPTKFNDLLQKNVMGQKKFTLDRLKRYLKTI